MIIQKECILLHVASNSKDEIIRMLAQCAANHGKLNDIEAFIQSVHRRESEYSTALGYDIAIPHGQDASVISPFVVVCRVLNPFIWDDRSENTVKCVFMIGVPFENREKTHLHILAQLSRNLIDEDFRSKLLQAEDVDEVFNLLDSLNSVS